ncbi:hypothetical protein A3B93_00700 [Candidatus Nomurabacteria bacterium RIFCSPHIGHO2_02_FULL_42_24]|uniref:Band 7 domain-containing protein n=1 Tax=Candidatus Nomurabacteria bacterium RIFCSPHIGHO2_02_FULL_42_24 TaxID=1801757 RepID=A0A1F6WHX9_9BACT|nr:MAG: SPFH domain / Band 7 family protein [Parcubacteria group bacterium GW2011_GWA2_42_18]OGI81500.1 MAG: hypothetical protein A3B93_00700 [Candidatus Nomurabacteria bacterium RIFCSPHIGHO2_02_FULL_42_24]
MTTILWILGVFLFLIIISGLRVINQYQKAIILTFGKYTGIKEPGLRFILIGVQKMIKVDMRIKVVDVPDQRAITKDNIAVNVNAVIYYRVSEAEKAILEVENFFYAVSQLAQTTMRNVVGEIELDELLGKRDKISDRIRQIVDEATDAWGLKVSNVELKDIALPVEMERTIAKQAEAEREKRATIINAEGEVISAQNMAKAAQILAAAPGALHLRTLHSINDISSDRSNTVVFAVPLEILRAIEGMKK